MRILSAFLFMASSAFAVEFQSRLINGTVVEPGTYKEVVRIRAEGAGCTATVVGPKTIVTAAHCARTGAIAEFTIDGTSYKAKMFRSTLYPKKDHDISVGVTDTEIKGVTPASVGGKAEVGLTLTLLGYGCIQPEGGDTPDGKLRKGDTAIVGLEQFDMVSRKANGAALCFGDSGGPAFITQSGKNILLGVNSKGNIRDTNYNARTDIPESQTFLKAVATDNAVEICGVNKNCNGGDPTPTAPTCTLSAMPSSVKIGNSLTLTLATTGEATSAVLDGFSVQPNSTKTITPTVEGSVTAKATVTGPGGSNSCTASYTVLPKDPDPGPTAPSCSITVAPTTIKLGQSVTASMSVSGQITNAQLEGKTIPVSGGSLSITPTTVGWLSVNGMVSGPGGSNTCRASYTVEGDEPLSPSGTFTIVPLHCGMNTVLETPVREVCMAAIQFKNVNRNISVKDVLLVGFADGSQEILPILVRKAKQPDPGDVQVKEELATYANMLKKIGTGLQMDIRKATLVTIPGQDLPVSLEGRSSNGQYFLVDKFRKLTGATK